MKRIALAFALLIASAAASFAQNVTVIGPITPGHCPQFSSTTVIKDGGFACSGAPGNAITALTGDGTATGPGSVPFTLATVNANVGSFGSATQCVAITTNGKGLITAASAVTCTPAVGSITGLGTGVATALGVALNGSGGIPSPTPTRAGDIIYWNGSNWVSLAGNNSGTQILSENASGVPAWTSAGAGSVQSVTCGTGLSGGTFTTTGTCAVSLTTATNTLGADVSMTVQSQFFDGPSMAQGTSGTWFVHGQVIVTAVTANEISVCKLWDGTTIVATTRATNANTSSVTELSLSGIIASPAGNIRISCENTSSANGKIVFNASGLSKDSSISGIRIQ